MAVAVVSLALVLVLVEAASRVLLPNRYFVWPPNFSMVFDAGANVSGVRFPSRLTINSQGMRGDELDGSHAYRLLAVGGSTTICVYLDDEQAWPHRLQQRLNAALGPGTVWVGNVGRPGHTTRQHVVQVEKLLGQYPEIDGVVLLIGINDLLQYLPTAGRPGPQVEPDPQQLLKMSFSFFPGWDQDTPWWQRNVAVRVWKLMRWQQGGDGERLRPMDEKGEFVAMLRGYRQRAGRMRQRLPELREGRAGYAGRVRRLIDLAKERGADLLLVTQPTLWRPGLSDAERKLLWAGGPPLDRLRDGATYYSAEALATAMQRYNETLLRLCEGRGVRCLDAASLMPRTTRVFYDDAHFTDYGSGLLADAIAAHLLEGEWLGHRIAEGR